MNVKIKKLILEAVIPSYSRSGDAGLDLTATSKEENSLYTEYGTGLAIAIPKGYVGYIFPRSSLSNYDQVLANHVGVIDSNYRGEIKFRFKNTVNLRDVPDFMSKTYNVGERVGQLIVMPIPEVQFEEVTELDETERGDKGYGSSGT